MHQIYEQGKRSHTRVYLPVVSLSHQALCESIALMQQKFEMQYLPSARRGLVRPHVESDIPGTLRSSLTKYRRLTDSDLDGDGAYGAEYIRQVTSQISAPKFMSETIPALNTNSIPTSLRWHSHSRIAKLAML